MIFSDFQRVKGFFKGKRVAVFGSAPTCLDNDGKKIDEYDLIVRVNNYRMVGERHGRKYDYRSRVGSRTDVFYSFFGSSIHKTPQELKTEGVRLCMSKLPDDKPIDSPWHEKKRKLEGVDYRAIYRRRKGFWFCPTYVPETKEFIALFEELGRHQPTTGFSAIWTIMRCEPEELYITGFDFFTSRIHNVNEPWRSKNVDDPICHRPEKEKEALKEMAKNNHTITLDKYLEAL